MDFITQNVNIVVGAGIVLASLALGFLSRRLLLASLKRLAERSAWQADDVVVASARGPLPILFVLGGLWVALRVVGIPSQWEPTTEKLLASLLVVTITLWAAGLATRMLEVGFRTEGAHARPVSGVLRVVVRAAVLALGGLVLLGNLGISIAPVLTTLGIGGLAVALALQDTLGNLFAGVHITLARNVRVGDYVKLEDGQEGFVEDIQWRATRVRTLPNNFVVIPNRRLAESIITNHHLPSKDLAVLEQVGVHYSSDLDRVERVTCEEGRTIMKRVSGGVPDFEPFIRYHTFGESSIDFTVILRAREFTDNFIVKHEFIKALSRRFAAEGIVIPFPIRAVNLEQEHAVLAAPARS